MHYIILILNLHLLYIRIVHMAFIYFFFSSKIEKATKLVCMFLLIAIMEGN